MPPAPMRIPPEIRAWVEIDLGRLELNVAEVRAALPPHLRYVAVVKADAYGHGLEPIVGRLMRAGVDVFAVANLVEAAAIREVGQGWPILVLSALLPGEESQAVQLDVMPTVSSEGEVERLEAAARRAGKTLGVHLKIDTGMGRLGVWHPHAPALYQKIRDAHHLRLAGLFTHFAASDSDPAFTAAQRELFLRTLERLPGWDDAPRLLHADNSAGLESFTHDGPFNGARVGLLQFGVSPHPGSLLAKVATQPVLTFHTRLSLIKDLPAGQTVSYGRTHRLERDTRVGILAAGYGDGIPTALSNRGRVLVRGHSCRILGRVTMDQTIVDLSAVPAAQPGDTATLIGAQSEEFVTAREFAFQSHQIPWEAFCAITGRVARFYRSDTAL
ncbi:MAG: alanine racemase [Opitutales bacterium]